MTSVCDAMLSSDEEDEQNDDVLEATSKADSGTKESSEEEEGSSSEDELEEGEELNQLRQSATPIDHSSSTKSFSELGLRSWLIQQLNTMRIVKPTPVQVICFVLSRRKYRKFSAELGR
ncbi:hypothetical protein COOONC_14318 [Cooperia oncophora]